MKKKIAAAVLLGLLVRAAMMAGAGEPVKEWVRSVNTDGKLVSATLNIELGGTEPAERTAALSAESARTWCNRLESHKGGRRETLWEEAESRERGGESA